MTRARRLWRRVRYFWDDLDPDGIELLSAMLSLSFAVVMIWRGSGTRTIDYIYWYAALCLAASLCKFVGVLFEWSVLRVAGLLLGVIFWATLAFRFATTSGSITWACFLVLMLAQLWAVRRVVHQGGGRAG